MDLSITRAQFDAVTNAKHLPDVLKAVLQRGTQNGAGVVLHLTYEEATALNELCSWNVHSDAQGKVTPESQPFDDLVRAILTHPDF
jgi:dTDP-4-dehydrorhamnose reductase